MAWYRNRFLWVAVILALTAGTVVLVNAAGSRAEPTAEAEPADLPGRLTARMRTTLEQLDPGQHNHAGHGIASAAVRPAVICGVRVYGFEPATATALADVRTVYGFHLCGVAEQKSPWDVAVKLAGPVILDLSADPPGVQVVEATAELRYVDRLRQMFPPQYAEIALKEALSEAEMSDLRRRYAVAAGL